MSTNRQRVFDLLANNPEMCFATLAIVTRLSASHASVLDALCWLTLAKKVERTRDTTTGRRGPHWQYRIVEGASRPADMRSLMSGGNSRRRVA